MSKLYKISIVGATGSVGQIVIRLLSQFNLPIKYIRAFGSGSSERTFTYNGKHSNVERLHEGCFEETDFAIFCATANVAREWAPEAIRSGCTVIDNSSHFRLDEDVPLIIPEINGEILNTLDGPRIISNPNCTTAIALMALYPLHRAFGLTRVIASSYQAVSGAGEAGRREFFSQIGRHTKGHSKIEVFGKQIVGNVIPRIGRFTPSGYTDEEMKMLHESRKILNLPTLEVSLTCVRVPVARAHSVSVVAMFERPVNIQDAARALTNAVGVEVFYGEDPTNSWPTPLEVTGKEHCYVGRLRKDIALPNALSLWVTGDQLLKGAALNAVQILNHIIHYQGRK